jgi:hypothetical protein
LTSVLQNFGDGILPPNILDLLTEALNPVFTSLIPGEEKFFSAIESAIASVQLAIASFLVQALDDAFKCFKSTLFLPISYAERLRRTRDCNRESAANHSSVFSDLKNLYLSITNQVHEAFISSQFSCMCILTAKCFTGFSSPLSSLAM